jgi:integrase
VGSRRTKGDGSLFQRTDGVWIGAVEIPSTDGKRRQRRVSSKDRNVCIEKLKKLRRDVEDGKIAVTANTTVQKWLHRWLTEIHATQIRPSTRKSYDGIIRLYINPHIGTKRLDKLTPQDVRQMHAKLQENNSTSAAKKAHVVLQRALEDAIKEGMLARNVAAIVHKPRHTEVERKPLTSDQVKQLLRASIARDDPMATRWAAAFLLGARQGELLGLQWARTDLDVGKIDLSRQLQQLQQVHGCGDCHSDGTYPCKRVRPGWCPQRHWDLPVGFEAQILHRSVALTPPKSKARIVPIPAPLWVMLQQHPYGEHNLHDLVWHRPDGRPIPPRDDYTNWRAALKAADLPPAPLHAARHTTATLLAEAGTPEQVTMKILGHSSIQVSRGYAHLDLALPRAAMSTALDDLLALG